MTPDTECAQIGAVGDALRRWRCASINEWGDERALVRRNKTGSTEMPWSEVLRVHRLSQAYLVEKAEGAMPLPYRCFTQAQRHAFESILRENNVPAAGDACCLWTPPASASD